MSYHLPILASDIPANKLLELNPGDYFKTGDALDLSKHIKQKLAQEFTRVDYPLDEYTWQNVSDKVTTIFDKNIKNNPSKYCLAILMGYFYIIGFIS